MIPRFLVLGKYKYLRTPLSEEDLLPLKTLLEKSKILLEESKELANKDFQNKLVLDGLNYHSRMFRAYSLLLNHIRSHPQDLKKILRIVTEDDDIIRQIRKLQKIGIDVDSHRPGEGMYESPASGHEKTVPLGRAVPPRSQTRFWGEG